MSTENKTDLDELENDRTLPGETSSPVKEESPENRSERSSAVSWNTPVSTIKSESTPSSVSWDTPKLLKLSGEYTEIVREINASENILIRSPTMSTAIIPDDDDPPPYSSVDRQSSWSPLTHIRDMFCEDSRLSANRSPELTNLIDDSTCATSIPGVSMPRSFSDQYSGNVKEDTFAGKYGTICIVACFIIFLMILSLIGKFVVNSAFRV